MGQENWLIIPGQSRIIDAEGIRALKVGLIGGQVDVIGHDEPTTRVEVHSVAGKDLKVTIDGDRLEVDHPQVGWDNFTDVFKSFSSKVKADVSIMVPHEVLLKFAVVSANALVSGIEGDSKVATVSGEVVVDRCIGTLDINSVSGEVSVRDHRGSITAHTVSGDLTVSGDIPSFSADAVSGSILIDNSGDPDSLKVKLVSGRLTLRLPRKRPTRYRVNAVSGKLQLDDVEYRGRGTQTGSWGELAGHWLDISVNTVSGDVAILHASAEASAEAASA